VEVGLELLEDILPKLSEEFAEPLCQKIFAKLIKTDNSTNDNCTKAMRFSTIMPEEFLGDACTKIVSQLLHKEAMGKADEMQREPSVCEVTTVGDVTAESGSQPRRYIDDAIDYMQLMAGREFGDLHERVAEELINNGAITKALDFAAKIPDEYSSGVHPILLNGIIDNSDCNQIMEYIATLPKEDEEHLLNIAILKLTMTNRTEQAQKLILFGNEDFQFRKNIELFDNLIEQKDLEGALRLFLMMPKDNLREHYSKMLYSLTELVPIDQLDELFKSVPSEKRQMTYHFFLDRLYKENKVAEAISLLNFLPSAYVAADHLEILESIPEEDLFNDLRQEVIFIENVHSQRPFIEKILQEIPMDRIVNHLQMYRRDNRDDLSCRYAALAIIMMEKQHLDLAKAAADKIENKFMRNRIVAKLA
jgi:hypothetical protein